MFEFRTYVLDDCERVLKARSFFSENDAEAIALAEEIKPAEYALELWRDLELVIRLEAGKQVGREERSEAA